MKTWTTPEPGDDWKPIETCTAGKVVWLLSKAHFFPFLGHIGHTHTGLGTTGKEFFDERGHIVFPIAWMEKGDWTKGEMPPMGPVKPGHYCGPDERDTAASNRFEIAGVQQDIKNIHEQIKHIREILDLQSKRLDRLDIHPSPYSQK